MDQHEQYIDDLTRVLTQFQRELVSKRDTVLRIVQLSFERYELKR